MAAEKTTDDYSVEVIVSVSGERRTFRDTGTIYNSPAPELHAVASLAACTSDARDWLASLPAPDPAEDEYATHCAVCGDVLPDPDGPGIRALPGGGRVCAHHDVGA